MKKQISNAFAKKILVICLLVAIPFAILYAQENSRDLATRAEEYQNKGDYKTALTYYEKALEKEDDSLYIKFYYYAAIVCCENLGSDYFEKGREFGAKALGIAPPESKFKKRYLQHLLHQKTE